MHRIIPEKTVLAMKRREAFSAKLYAPEERVGPLFSSLALTRNRPTSPRNLLFGHQRCALGKDGKKATGVTEGNQSSVGFFNWWCLAIQES